MPATRAAIPVAPGIMEAMRALRARLRSRRPVDRGLLAASLGIALGVVAIGYALLTATSASDRTLPEGIESVLPVQDAPQALAQTQVIVDLVEGYIGEMTIDGTALETIRLDEVPQPAPGAQPEFELSPGAVYEPGNATLTFTPSDNAEIERFASGRHQISVVYWPLEEGRDAARTFIWYFTAV